MRIVPTLKTALFVFILGILTAPGVGHAQIVISEVMYNPNSNEGWPPDPNDPDDKGEPNKVEWVELYNAGAEPVDISGWALADEDGQTKAVRDGAVIQPGEAVVLVPVHTSASAFHAAWGGTFAVYPVAQWGEDGLYNLANGPSPDNEILRLIDIDGTTVDEVNYDDEGDWPSDRPDGASIYLPADKLNTELNDQGVNWRLSEAGTDKAKKNKPAGAFKGVDIGSPGRVPAEES
jgi:lamin tail-like protein